MSVESSSLAVLRSSEIRRPIPRAPYIDVAVYSETPEDLTYHFSISELFPCTYCVSRRSSRSGNHGRFIVGFSRSLRVGVDSPGDADAAHLPEFSELYESFWFYQVICTHNWCGYRSPRQEYLTPIELASELIRFARSETYRPLRQQVRKAFRFCRPLLLGPHAEHRNLLPELVTDFAFQELEADDAEATNSYSDTDVSD